MRERWHGSMGCRTQCDRGESLAQAGTHSHTVELCLQTKCEGYRKEVLLLNASAKRIQEQRVAGLLGWAWVSSPLLSCTFLASALR